MSQPMSPTDESDRGPYADAPQAELIDGDSSTVYTLVGGILREAGATEEDGFQHLVAPGLVREFSSDLLPLFQFFQVARTEQQAIAWLDWAGAPAGTLKDLIDTGILVRVDTTSPLRATASLKGIRIIPHSMPGEPDRDHPTLVPVRRGPDSPIETYIPIELEHVLWGLQAPLDIPTAIKRMAREAHERKYLTARRVLTCIPEVLRLGLARLEWVVAPRL